MKSLHIIASKQLGGADQFFLRLVSALNETGHRATPVCRPNMPIDRALADSGAERINLPMRNQWDAVSAWQIRRLALRKANIAQTYMGRATRLTRLPKSGRCVHIARLGGYYKLDGYYRHAHAWIGNTKGLCDHLVKSGLPADKVFHIGNFVPERTEYSDTQRSAIRESLNVPQDALILFALGRFIGIKGFDDLIKAFAEVPAEIHGRPIHLVIAGDGPLAQPLRELSDSTAGCDRVHWAGWHNNASPFFDLADLAICPSRMETLGNVILEAWSYQKPVVSTTTAGATELIEDESNGLLTPCENPALLAARITELLEADEPVRQSIARAGYNCLQANHNKIAVVSAYLELYKALRAERSE